MDLQLDAVNFSPGWGRPDEWNGAYEKLESYLRAYEVDSHLHRAHLITVILRRVNLRWNDRTPPAPPAALAMDEANRMIEDWFRRLLDAPAVAGGFTAADGRVALFLCNGPLRWPYAFLAEGELPGDFKAAMRASLMRAGPELQIGSMVPRPIDLGLIPEIADDAMDALNRRPLIKALIGWLLLIGLLAFLFRITR